MKKHPILDVTLAEIQEARHRLSRFLEPSPLIFNSWLSELYECRIYLKLENMQPIGSFKIRGATNKIATLSSDEKKRGVIAASAGNHAQGVAWASKVLGAKALIVMPASAPLLKIHNTRALGAQVVLQGDTFDEAYDYAEKLARKTKRILIQAFEDKQVIAGQGTIALEIMEQLPDVDFVIGAMGGGGLMSGISIALKEIRPQATLIGCQSAGASALLRSIRRGTLVHPVPVNTFADGVAVGEARASMLRLLSRVLDDTVEVDDESIAAAVLTLMEKAKVVAEGAGALPLAALEHLRKRIRGKKIILVVSGGNIDVNLLARIIDRGLIRSGRRLRVNVLISDRPGSLARLTHLIATEGGNVLQTIHDRNEPTTHIDQTGVALTIETRGPDHSDSLVRALKKHVLRFELAP